MNPLIIAQLLQILVQTAGQVATTAHMISEYQAGRITEEQALAHIRSLSDPAKNPPTADLFGGAPVEG